MRAKNAKKRERSSWIKLFSEQGCRLVATGMTSGGFGVNTALTIPLMVLIALRVGWLSWVIDWSGRRLKMLTRLFISLRSGDSQILIAIHYPFSFVL